MSHYTGEAPFELVELTRFLLRSVKAMNNYIDANPGVVPNGELSELVEEVAFTAFDVSETIRGLDRSEDIRIVAQIDAEAEQRVS